MDFRFDPLDTSPTYRQLADYIRKAIENGVWAPGQALPSESELCRENGLSRTTIRLAFKELMNDGRIIRRQGLGSFVTEPKMQRNLNNLYSFTDDMIKAGKEPYSKILLQTVRRAGTELSVKLAVLESEKVFCLKRIRLADNKPVLVETTCIPYDLCRGIETENFERSSLYAKLAERYGLIPCRAVETHEAILIPPAEAEGLHAERGSPAFLITRSGYLPDGRIFEYTESITPGDRCRFEIGLNGPRKGITIQRGYSKNV